MARGRGGDPRHRGDPPRSRRGRLLAGARRRGVDRDHQRDPPAGDRSPPPALHGRARVPARPAGERGCAPARRPARRRARGGRLRLGAPRLAPDRRRDDDPAGDPGHERRRRLLAPRRPPSGAEVGRPAEDRGPRNPLPRDRRAFETGAPARDARRQRAEHGELARSVDAPTRRVGDRSLLADGCEPGGDPARLEREHPGLPLGREGADGADGVLQPRRLRGARAAARGRRPAPRRGREPRQPPLGRGRPCPADRQPGSRGEEVQSGLQGVLRQRLQRHPDARARRVGGDPRGGRLRPPAPPRRKAPRPPWRHLPAPAGGDVRRRPRPDGVRRALRHVRRPAGDLRDLRELRRGRPPFRPRATGHAGGAAQARRAVRAARACTRVCPAAVPHRRALGSRADAGRHLRAAERLRARGSRAPLRRRERRARGVGRGREPHERRRRLRRGDRAG